MLDHIGYEKTYDFINNNVFDKKDYWLLLIWECIPEENIDNKDQTVTYRKPEIPQKPDDKSPSSSVRKSPKTGDEIPVFLWILLLGSFGISIAAGINIFKKKQIQKRHL